MRAVAVLLSFALIHVSFGQQAWSQVVPVGNVAAPVSGSAAGANAVLGMSPNASFVPSFSASNVGLTGGLSAPSISPLPSAIPSAINAVGVKSAVSVAVTPAASFEAAPASVLTPAALQPAKMSVAAASKSDETPAKKGETSAPAALKPAVATKSAASKAMAIVNGVIAAFRGKSAQTTPSGEDKGDVAAPNALAANASHLSAPMAGDDVPPSEDAAKPQSGGGKNEPPVPPSNPNNGGNNDGKKGWFGLGAIVMGLIGGMLVMQLGLEAQGAAMAQLTEDAFGDFSILAQVAIFASIGSMVGQQLAGFFSSKFGLTKTFYAAHALRALSLGTMVFLLGTGHMALPMMFAFYLLNGVVTGVAATAEGTLRKFLLQQQGVSQQKFRTWWQLLAEVVAVPAPILLGSLVVSLGAGWITALYPATIIAGLMMFFMLKIIPWKAAARIENAAQAAQPAPAPQTPADPNAPKKGAWQKIKDAVGKIFANMEEGKDFVFKNPLLKFSLIAATIFDLMNVLIYRLITPGYGKLVAGSEGMAAVQGNLVGMFSLGGLLLAATFLLLDKRAKKKEGSMSDADKAAAERSSMLKWMFWGIPALGLLGVMAFNLTLPFSPLVLLGTNWMPGTMLGLMLIPFGFFQVAASIKLNSYFQERLPADAGAVQKAIAFSGSAMTALSIVLMLALKPLFGDIAAFNPFPWMAAALIPVGVGLFFLHRKLAKATTPGEARIALNAPGEKTAGGFAGMLLGVIAAALFLSFLPMIPGAAGVIAGLGVLGKFALHLGVALAIPAAGWFVDRKIRARGAKK